MSKTKNKGINKFKRILDDVLTDIRYTSIEQFKITKDWEEDKHFNKEFINNLVLCVVATYSQSFQDKKENIQDAEIIETKQ